MAAFWSSVVWLGLQILQRTRWRPPGLLLVGRGLLSWVGVLHGGFGVLQGSGVVYDGSIRNWCP